MITKEHAAAQLKKFQVPDWSERRREGLRKLSVELRQAGELLMPRKLSYEEFIQLVLAFPCGAPGSEGRHACTGLQAWGRHELRECTARERR